MSAGSACLIARWKGRDIMPLQVEINPEFQKALDLLEGTHQHLFITGKAGTGKSTLLNYAYAHSAKRIVLLAPTGVAALNIKGQTIHRFFGFPINISPAQIESGEFKPRATRIYKHLQTLIIDEASMLRADLLDCINIFLRKFGPDENKSFGGVQMVFVGDLYQLPPVVGPREREIFADHYETPYFFSADVFRQIPLQVVELKKIYRQKDNVFIGLLNNIRNNMASAEDLQRLNGRVGADVNAEGAEEFKITLTTTNQAADTVNRQMLEALDGILYISEAEIEGDFGQEYYPAAERLEFKIGAQIMFLNNDAQNRWVNGSVGHIESVRFRDERLSHINVRLQAGQRLVAVFPFEWEVCKYKLEGKEIISEVVGTFLQFPFRMAWAVTIHKSQGKTFDRVEIDIGHGTFAAGQLYVALSRCTSLEGISLKKPVSARHVMVDERINGFLCRYCEDTAMPELQKKRRLCRAAEQQAEIGLVYRKPDGQNYRRRVVPVEVGNGVLIAECRERNALRRFEIKRIINILD